MKGLELSLICTIDLHANTAYALDAKQTLDSYHETRIDFYANQVKALASSLQQQGIGYLAADAYYSKVKFVDTVCSTHLHMIGKLRTDANLQWYFEGPYAGTGRPKQYDGKVDFQADMDRFDRIGVLDGDIEVYSAVVRAKALKRKFEWFCCAGRLRAAREAHYCFRRMPDWMQ